jgi:hypothetical protein
MREVKLLCSGLLVVAMAIVLSQPVQAFEGPTKTRTLPAATKQKVDFVRDIQPLFRKNCYSCHAVETQEAGLRLDRKKLAQLGSDRGPVIVAGKSAESRLVQVLVGLDKEIGVMPPDGEGTPLTDLKISLIRGWIDQGATWPESADEAVAGSKHWAFQPIQQPKVPRVKNVSQVNNPIDAFVLEKLQRRNLGLSPRAGRSQLIRRVYLDVLGLAPSPQEVLTFLEDKREDAYQQLLRRVLNSPHYGERWGRHWLDLARYADSDGYEKDRPRPFAWQYRDWVIQALNADMPYDEFTIAQIAGDMLPEATIAQRVASGFHRNTLHNTEGGTDKEEDRVKKTVDRTNTVGAIWLGLTVGCAQCHSHKYDPITQREYYSMYAFFNNIDESDIAAPTFTERKKFIVAKAAFDEEQKRLKHAIHEYEKTRLPAAQEAWAAEAARQKVTWRPFQVAQATAVKGTVLTVQADQSVLATGKNEQSDVYTISGELTAGKLAAIRLEVLPHKSLVKQGPGRASNGNFVLTTFRATLTFSEDQAKPVPVKFARARADFSQKDWAVALAINSSPKDGWAVSPQFGQRHLAAFELETAVEIPPGTTLTITLDQAYNGSGTHNLGYFRLSTTETAGMVPLDGLPVPVSEALAVPTSERNEQQQQVLSKFYRGLDPQLTKLTAALAAYEQKAPKQSGNKAQAVVERSQSRTANIHVRGNFLSKGAVVQADTLAVLPTLESKAERPNRLDFANWLVSGQHPLTARVVVNRIWRGYFGNGLVATTDDFGSQGELPSHPELLDFLAMELQQNQWSLKHLHRLIMTSATYQQSATVRPELQKHDPGNRLLGRQSRHRVEAEIVRDLALSVSGLLDRRVGGPSVRPPQPTEYSSLTYANSAKWQTSKGGDQYRRGMYTFFQRTSPYPMLMIFDAPDSNECAAQRSSSNTPMQALAIWNDVVFFECAQYLGLRIVSGSAPKADSVEKVRQRIRHAFLLCLARYPTDEELTTVDAFYRSQLELCRADTAGRDKILGPLKPSAEVTADELAAWILVGRALINLDEFISRE